MQPAESNRGQHPVCCPLLDSAGWVLILQSIHRGALRAAEERESKTSDQPAEPNRGQHPVCCHLLDSAGWVLILQSTHGGRVASLYKGIVE